RVVDAALVLGEARPSAGPRIRAKHHPPRTRRAADRGISIEEQRIDDDAALGDVRLNVRVGPPSDGVDLDLPELCVVLDHRGARGRTVLQASYRASARRNGSTFRIAQHRSGSRAKRSAP